MNSLFFVIPILAILIIGSANLASAQFQGGGVDHPGTWFVGEGLKKGDFFSYELCHVDYKDCAEFEMDLWVEGDITVGTEQKWLVQTVIYDGNKIVKGSMELGKVAPEPSGGTGDIGAYRSAFKTSIVWLSAFATADIGEQTEGPKAFSAPSWGKIANIGGEQIIPTALETVSVQAGTFDSILISWKTGGYESYVWVVDDFPFPVKAHTLTQVSEGIPPTEYVFELLDYKENVNTNPFTGIIETAQQQAESGCPQNYDLVSLKRTTKNANYLIDMKYGPEEPNPGCEIEWLINFKNKFDETEFLNQVQYDIFVVDDKQSLPPLRSIAGDEGRDFLYSQSGQVQRSVLVEEPPGTAHYIIWIYGLAPAHIVPSTEPDFLAIDIPISGEPGPSPIPVPPPSSSLNIPNWIKNNAGWWANDQIEDSDFVSGIQFLINQGIMKIPATTPGSGTGTDEIPNWIKNNAGWWANDQISDNDFVSGIQYLIENGIMKLA